jgi:hypothetical protein
MVGAFGREGNPKGMKEMLDLDGSSDVTIERLLLTGCLLFFNRFCRLPWPLFTVWSKDHP